MRGYIDGIDFSVLPAERYWSFPSAFKGDKEEEIRNMILSQKYLGSEKKDGYFEKFLKDEDGTMMLISRIGVSKATGSLIDKIGHVPHLHEFFSELPKGTCLLGEVYFKNKPGSRNITSIMGCLEKEAIRRQEKGEKLSYYVFDILAWNGQSFLGKPAKERFSIVNRLETTVRARGHEHVEVARYYRGEDLLALLNDVRSNGGEGIVITMADSLPEPGKRTSRKTLKIKKELDDPIDVFLTGTYKPASAEYKGKDIEGWRFWRNEKTGELLPEGTHFASYSSGATILPVTKGFYHGWAGSVEYAAYDEDKDEIVSLGWISSVTDSIKEGIVTNNEDYIKKVCVVNAMEVDPKERTFRHARISQWRDDITWKDCTIDKIF